MKILLFSLLLCFVSTPLIANVCDRDPGLRDAIVEKVQKPCSEITKSDLSKITSLEYEGRMMYGRHYFSTDQDPINRKWSHNYSGLTGLTKLKVTIQTDATPMIVPDAFENLKKLNYLSIEVKDIGLIVRGRVYSDVFCSLSPGTQISFDVIPDNTWFPPNHLFKWIFYNGSMNCTEDKKILLNPSEYFELESNTQ